MRRKHLEPEELQNGQQNKNADGSMGTSPNSSPVRANSRFWRSLPALVLLLGLALTALVYRESAQNLQARQSAFFQSEVRKSVSLIQMRMERYQQILRGAAGLFMVQDRVSRAQFRRYVELQGLGDDLTGLQGIGYAQLIRPEQLQAQVQAVRREGYPDYQLKPAGERTLYTAIVYLEPLIGRNLRAFGYDMYSEPVRREAMQRAADSGRIALSGKVRLVQEDGRSEQPGFLIYAPVYRPGPPVATVTERRARLLGWAYAPVRMNDFMQGLLGEYAGELLIDIHDGIDLNPASLMHTEEAPNPSAARPSSSLTVTRTLSLMGHNWTLRIRPSPLTLSRLDSNLPTLLGLGGVVTSVMLALLVRVLVGGRERALELAQAMTAELVQERARLRAILEGTNVGTWEWNVQTGATAFNEQWMRMLGYEPQELAPTTIDTWSRLTHPDDLARAQQKLRQHFNGETDHYECELRMQHKQGHWVWVLGRGKVSHWSDHGQPLMMYGTTQDITLRKEREQAYKYDAQHDQLTGLPNRLLLADRLERALLSARRENKQVALMFMDLDGFKGVNDTYGHDAGDVVLRTMARRIQHAIRASDTLARIGGDEFVVLLPDIGNADNARTLAHKIAAEARRAVQLNDTAQAALSLSIGIALHPAHGDDAATLTEHADQAMYKAKRSGKDAVVVYEPGWAPSETVPGILH